MIDLAPLLAKWNKALEAKEHEHLHEIGQEIRTARESNTYEHMFETAINHVWLSGGDGWAAIVSDRYKELAADFEKYTSRSEFRKGEAKEEFLCVVFYSTCSDQEHVVFTSPRTKFDFRMYECVIFDTFAYAEFMRSRK